MLEELKSSSSSSSFFFFLSFLYLDSCVLAHLVISFNDFLVLLSSYR